MLRPVRQSESIELSFSSGPITLSSITGKANGVRRERVTAREKTSTGERRDVRTGTRTSLSVVGQEGNVSLSFDTKLHANVPLADDNRVSVVFVTGPDGVEQLGMLVNHDGKTALWGDVRRLATELGAPSTRPWWATVLLFPAFILLIVGLIAAVDRPARRLVPSPPLLLVLGALCLGLSIFLPRLRLRAAVRELRDAIESFSGRLPAS
jgi:hypothetical protein